MNHAGIDAGTVGLTLLLVSLTAVLSGLPPCAAGQQESSLRSGCGAANATGNLFSAGTRRLRDLLLMLQAGLAVSLLVVGMLLARSFVALTTVDPGYSPDNVLTVGIRVPGGFEASDERKRLMQATLERVRAVPGVVAAGGSNMMPLDNRAYLAGFPRAPHPRRAASARRGDGACATRSPRGTPKRCVCGWWTGGSSTTAIRRAGYSRSS